MKQSTNIKVWIDHLERLVTKLVNVWISNLPTWRATYSGAISLFRKSRNLDYYYYTTILLHFYLYHNFSFIITVDMEKI